MATFHFASAYARQAQADFDAMEALAKATELRQCHSLHFLQMACEKLCKAHLLLLMGDERASELMSSHAYVRKHLPVILEVEMNLAGFRRPQRRSLGRWFRQIASEIEILAPALDRDGRRQDNTEYPWRDSQGRVFAPIDYEFNTVDLQRVPQFLIFLRRAIERIAKEAQQKVQQPESRGLKP